MRRLPSIVALGLLVVACEDDPLAPVSGFTPSDCLDPARCSEGGTRLDSGTVLADGGPSVGELDGGDRPVQADAGVELDSGTMAPDAGDVDSGAPDVGPPPTDFLDVSGQWQTTYDFDTSDYLFGISGIANEISLIVNAIDGNISTGFPPLDNFIQNIVMQYVPPQIIQILRILNTLATFSERMEARGVMTVVQHPAAGASEPSVNLDATELWSEVTVFIVDQCPLGRQDPNFPQCARYNIQTVQQPATAGPLQIGVDVKPFSGTLDAIQNGSTLAFFNREVEVEMGRLILLVVDAIVQFASGGQYTSLRGMLRGIINCPGLAQNAASWAQANLGIGAIPALALRALIEDQCNDAIDDIVDQVGLITVDWDAFEFDQYGVAKDYTADNVADELQVMSVPRGVRNGRFRLLLSSSMEGVWQGIR